jgi:pyruvate ferredoxin oxidoreductase gamma subunit
MGYCGKSALSFLYPALQIYTPENMAKEVFEVRIHGRGGQGGKTAAQFIAESGMDEGKYVQAFPEYGPERSGAPVTAYARISDEKIRLYQPVHNPDIVLVIDETLLCSIDAGEGADKDSILIVNTPRKAKDVAEETRFPGKVYTVDATKISIDATGVNKPNVPILGAMIKARDIIKIEGVENKIKQKFLKKLGEEKTQATINAIRRAYDEVSE